MRVVGLPLLIGLVAHLYAQSGCGPCTVNNTLAPRTFDPPYLEIREGVDTVVVIQFALPETVSAPSPLNYIYPNFAIYVDSLRLDGGNTYVSLAGDPNTAPSYNSTNPAAGALRFDQDHRYKQVRSSAPTHDNVVVYRNPGGGSPSNPTPPRGCVRACIRGIAPTPSGQDDTLRILLRGFVDPNTIDLFTGSSSDINNKDTTDLIPNLFGQPLYSDAWTAYAVRVLANPSAAIIRSVLSGLSVQPNPAWGQAELSYTLHRPATVQLRILSLSGQEILREVLPNRSAGTSTYALSLPAGIYLIELQAGAEKLQQKLVVL